MYLHETDKTPTLLTSEAVRNLLNVDQSTIYRMAGDGRLPAIKVGRQWRFQAEAIERWLAERNSGTVTSMPVSPNASRRLLDSPTTQAAVDLAADLLEAMLIVTDIEGNALFASNSFDLHAAIKKHLPDGRRQIEDHRKLLSAFNLETRLTPNYLGLLWTHSFIKIGTVLAGSVIAGGIAPEVWPPLPHQLKRLAHSLELSVEELTPQLHKVHWLDGAGRQRVLDTLPRVAELIARVAKPEIAWEESTLRPGTAEATAKTTRAALALAERGGVCMCSGNPGTSSEGRRPSGTAQTQLLDSGIISP